MIECYNMSKKNNISKRRLDKALQSHSKYSLKFKCTEKYSALSTLIKFVLNIRLVGELVIKGMKLFCGQFRIS